MTDVNPIFTDVDTVKEVPNSQIHSNYVSWPQRIGQGKKGKERSGVTGVQENAINAGDNSIEDATQIDSDHVSWPQQNGTQTAEVIPNSQVDSNFPAWLRSDQTSNDGEKKTSRITTQSKFDAQAETAPLPILRTVVKTSLAHAGWRREYIAPLTDLVNRVNLIISHARLFIKDIFVHEDVNNVEAWNLLDKQIFYELVILAVGGHERKMIEDESRISKMNNAARLANQAACLIGRHKARFFRQLGLRPAKMVHLHQISHYEGTKIVPAF